ncbi:Retrovirus-related Pol polyprotein LINE-1 [Senna tora]|uniref:Retrovirus-related Pol polyprotein LINE-1 n=1 Tax=Senna tora TaxID=362788 RepID=A0A835C6P1_9FABA|nr:Retrovirus-related Pol polyprotein LINE-1 [Senna tora]
MSNTNKPKNTCQASKNPNQVHTKDSNRPNTPTPPTSEEVSRVSKKKPPDVNESLWLIKAREHLLQNRGEDALSALGATVVYHNNLGAGSKTFPFLLNDMISIHNIGFVALLETRISGRKADAVMKKKSTSRYPSVLKLKASQAGYGLHGMMLYMMLIFCGPEHT